MKEKRREEPGDTPIVDSSDDLCADEDKVGPVIVNPICPTFSKAESAVVMALIRSGWSTAVLGSRKGFELLARVEDEMKAAGAVDNELPPVRGQILA